MKKILLPIWIVCCVLLYGCKDNVVCPAFQSTYILDDSIRMARYSLFLNDSTPKFAMASRRNKFGVNKKTNLFIKDYELMTAPKKNVLGPPSKEPLYYHEPEPEFVASDFTDVDSLGTDSLEVKPEAVPEFIVTEDKGPKYKYRYHPNNSYNQEQEYYNKYYGELFEDNRPAPPTPEELAQQLQDEGLNNTDSDSTTVEKKKKEPKKKKEKESEEEGGSQVDAETLKEAQKAKEETPAPVEEEMPVPVEEETPAPSDEE